MTQADAVPTGERLYRNYARKVAADGIITADERYYLDLLASALGIGMGRCDEIEASGKSKVYRDAVVRVMAGGIVTDEEARELELPRTSLKRMNAELISPGIVQNVSDASE